jgi:SAM-dependent methyltransferase
MPQKQDVINHEIKWTDEKIARLWDYYSTDPCYGQMYFAKMVGKEILRKTMSVIGLFNGMTILDFGCGPAYLLNYLNQMKLKPFKYIGLDFSKDSILDNDFFKNVLFDASSMVLTGFPSSIKSDSVDVCFLLEVVEHLNEQYFSDSIKDIYRVLAPGGYLVITTPNEEDLNKNKLFCPDCGCIFHKWQHVRSWSPVSLVKSIESFGFNLSYLKTLTFTQSLYLKARLKFKAILGYKNKDNSIYAIFKK